MRRDWPRAAGRKTGRHGFIEIGGAARYLPQRRDGPRRIARSGKRLADGSKVMGALRSIERARPGPQFDQHDQRMPIAHDDVPSLQQLPGNPVLKRRQRLELRRAQRRQFLEIRKQRPPRAVALHQQLG